jgi:hypothetical protein
VSRASFRENLSSRNAHDRPARDDIAALQFSPMQRALSACNVDAGPCVHGANGKDLKFMSNEAAGNQTYMIVAALLMVGLLTFGMLHSFGVFR